MAWGDVKSWAYQLQNPDVEEIEGWEADLFVIDYSRDGTEGGRFSRGDVERMRRGEGNRPRRIVAYMSIGEAEPYRFYWREEWRPGSPAWLLQPNPDWPDNYRVRFWARPWREVLLDRNEGYLTRILEAGFDGVYLDIVDGYRDFEKERPTARAEMIRLVRAIAEQARRIDEDFGVFPQNAPELLEDEAYLSILTGVGKEETYFLATDRRQDEGETEWTETMLDRVVARRGLVLEVDYCERPRNVREARRRARERGYLPYCTTVKLDRLVRQ